MFNLRGTRVVEVIFNKQKHMFKSLKYWQCETSRCLTLSPAHLFLWPAYTQACLPQMGRCLVKTEGAHSCGCRLEECLPSGGENVISWDQRIRGRFLFLSLSFSLHVLLTHAGTLAFLTCALLSLTYTHTHAWSFRWRKMTPFLSAISSVFTYLGLGYKRQPCVFMWQNTQRSVQIWETWIA